MVSVCKRTITHNFVYFLSYSNDSLGYTWQSSNDLNFDRLVFYSQFTDYNQFDFVNNIILWQVLCII